MSRNLKVTYEELPNNFIENDNVSAAAHEAMKFCRLVPVQNSRSQTHAYPLAVILKCVFKDSFARQSVKQVKELLDDWFRSARSDLSLKSTQKVLKDHGFHVHLAHIALETPDEKIIHLIQSDHRNASLICIATSQGMYDTQTDAVGFVLDDPERLHLGIPLATFQSKLAPHIA